MAATPPRPASPAPVVVPKPGHSLQISPNLEALLEHDELTRRNNSSPTASAHHASSSGFPISLPPPPPRRANGGRRAAGQREQESSVPTPRGRDGQRTMRSVVVAGADFWPATDGSAASPSVSGSSSRPATPNPYLNPAPVLSPINSPDFDQVPTPKQTDKPDPSPPAPEARGRPPTALHKVEKILWMGRDSLSLFSGPANGMRRDSDHRRNDRTESGDFDAVQDRQMRQVPAPSPTVSRPSSTFGDCDTATVALSSRPTPSYFHSLLQGPSGTPILTSDPPPLPPAYLPPRLSLPSVFMPRDSPQRHQSVGSVSGDDYLSFIDFRSPSTSDDSNPSHTQDGNPQNVRSSRRQLQSISIPPPSIYSISHHNLSSASLASMKFAPPPSPTSTVHQPSPTYPDSANSSLSVGLPSMIFAPPSPSVERIPTRLQPLSGPPSPYSPLEFAPLHNPGCGAIGQPLSITQELTPERGRKFKSKRRSKSSSPYHHHNSVSPLPPTTNQLDANERADRIRRNRKLARVFGRAPCVEEPITDVDDPRVSKKLHPPSLAALLTKQKTHRHAVSVSVSLKTPGTKAGLSTPWTSDLWSPDGRRHSTPLATDFTLYVDRGRDRTATKGPRRPRTLVDSPEAASTRSFIDLSDEDPRDDVSDLSCFTVHQNRCRRLHYSNSTPSLVESIDSVAQAEIERRQKREKLARLHRFLGSCVPPEAVSGSVFGPPLPLPAAHIEPDRGLWLRGNKNALSDEFDRGKEELDEREKALNVRRAQKMEKVFGTPPPQVLYHTRPCRPTGSLSQPTSPVDANPVALTIDVSSRNPNQSAYVGKTLHRPGPSDSSRCLLPWKEDAQSSPESFAESFADSFSESLTGYQQVLAQSSVYLNYQHSLNSLIDIIDRDDRRSLIELHRFLHGEADDSSSEEEVALDSRRASNAPSSKSERRHSLPSNASMTSLSSEFYASPEVLRFQIRRRKAAKLTNFFGVDYRELIHDILESIEKGVEEERKQGTLQPQEVEVLMHRVRNLRTMKDPFQS